MNRVPAGLMKRVFRATPITEESMFMTTNCGKYLIVLSLFVLMLCAASTGQAATFYQTVSLKTDTALTGATVIDFNGAGKGTYTIFGSDGVTFTTVDSHLRIDDSDSSWRAGNGQYIDNGAPPSNPGFLTLRIDFPGTVDAFGFNFQYANTNTWRLTAYNDSGTSLRQIGLGTSGLTDYFRGIKVNTVNGDGISTIKYAILEEITGTYDWVFIDNFYYKTTSSVPIPGSVLLLAPGLIGLAGIRRRIKK
jgi:hypothetical protein